MSMPRALTMASTAFRCPRSPIPLTTTRVSISPKSKMLIMKHFRSTFERADQSMAHGVSRRSFTSTSSRRALAFSNEQEAAAAKAGSVVVDFGRGFPSLEMLPAELMREAAQHAFRNKELLRYGPERGSEAALKALAAFLNANVGYRYHDYSPGQSSAPLNQSHQSQNQNEIVKSDHLMITGGCSIALGMICQVLTKPGDVIVVEDPTYFLALEIFKRDHQLRVVAAPMDDEGLLVNDNLEKIFLEEKPKLLYIIPTHHNPTGRTLPTQRRRALVEMARRNDVVVVADEVYQLVNHGGVVPPPPFISLVEPTDDDISKAVVSLGSFAKILAPGVRLGWLMTPNKTLMKKLSTMGFLLSGGNFNMTSGIVTSMIELGLLQKQLAIYNAQYEERTRYGCSLLKANFAHLLDFQNPRGGYFVWATLKRGMADEALLQKCKSRGVSFRHGALFAADKEGEKRAANALRLCFVHWNTEDIEKGLAALKSCLEDN